VNVKGGGVDMDPQGILELGEYNMLNYFQISSLGVKTIYVLLFLIMASGLIIFISKIKRFSEQVGLLIFTAGFLVSILFFLFEGEANFLEKWKLDYVTPYILNLKEERAPLHSVVEIDPHENVHEFFGKQKNQLKALRIRYSNGGNILKEVDVYAQVKFIDKKSEGPYIIFKELKRDLGNNLTPGLYNATIFVHKKY
jgi:hypothetical protein